MFKKIVSGLIIGAAASGCTAEIEPEEPLGTSTEELSCTDPQTKTYELEATLAVAVANELRRWEPDIDFYIDYNTYSVRLTRAGLDQCARNGKSGCPVVSDILQLQYYGTPEIVGHSEHQFRGVLFAHMDRYLAYRQRTYVPRIDNVTLSPSHVTRWSCGPMNWFVTSDPDASKLWSKMIAYGGADRLGGTAENPFLNFTTSGNQVGIDPNNDMTGAVTTTSSGSCSTAPSKIDYTGSCSGTCCYVSGKYGRYVKVYGTRATYSCAPW